jgi:transglutaminase-like putative cysteine protease
MLFEITHRTEYRYGRSASEAYIEARLTPPSLAEQTIESHELSFDPASAVSTYVDSFGNTVTVFSMTRRHEKLSLLNRALVRTREIPRPDDSLAVRVAETRQVFSSRLADFFIYLQPTSVVPTGPIATDWAQRFFPGDAPLGKALEALNQSIHKKFRYDSAATDTSTPLAAVWKQRAGVCQDFAHVMLNVLRTAGIPARYVCGYIESDPVRPTPGASRLVGSLATHAWVEVLTPGLNWVALDPTNNQWCGPRHVTMSYGRDAADASPVRGTFKGSRAQAMTVKVTMKRRPEKI